MRSDFRFSSLVVWPVGLICGFSPNSACRPPTGVCSQGWPGALGSGPVRTEHGGGTAASCGSPGGDRCVGPSVAVRGLVLSVMRCAGRPVAMDTSDLALVGTFPCSHHQLKTANPGGAVFSAQQWVHVGQPRPSSWFSILFG